MIHYLCEGCGVEVHGFGRSTVPEHGFCATCEWLNTYMRSPDMREFWEVYDKIARVNRVHHGEDAEG